MELELELSDQNRVLDSMELLMMSTERVALWRPLIGSPVTLPHTHP